MAASAPHKKRRRDFTLKLSRGSFEKALRAKVAADLGMSLSNLWKLLDGSEGMSYERSKKIQAYLRCQWGRLFKIVRTKRRRHGKTNR